MHDVWWFTVCSVFAANFMYFAAYTASSQVLLLGSRFVAGMI